VLSDGRTRVFLLRILPEPSVPKHIIYFFPQSFRKLDEFSPGVLMRHSRKDYLALRRASRQINGAFGKQNIQNIARLKTKSHEEETEKLKTMGYLH